MANIPIPINDNYYILRRAHISTDELTVMDGTFDVSDNSHFYPLSGEQLNWLLGDIAPTEVNVSDDSMQGTYSIAAVSPETTVPAQLIVLFAIEPGDGSTVMKLVLYNIMGNAADFVDLGYLRNTETFTLNDDEQETEINVSTTSLVTLDVNNSNLTISIAGKAGNASPYATFTKQIKYDYSNDTFILQGIETEYSNDTIKSFYPHDDIYDLRYLPRSASINKPKALNELINRDDIAQEIVADPHGEAATAINVVTRQMLESYPQDVFHWLTYHYRNDENKKLLGIIEQIYKNEMVDRDVMKAEAQKTGNTKIALFMNSHFNKWDKEIE